MKRQKFFPLLLTSAVLLMPVIAEANSSVYSHDEKAELNKEQLKAKQESHSQAVPKDSTKNKTEKRKELKDTPKKFEKGHLNY